MDKILAILASLDISGILAGLLMIVGGAAAIATMTPTPKDDAILAKVKKVLDIIAMNIGKAKNAEDEADK